jgi:ribose transport system permease protein
VDEQPSAGSGPLDSVAASASVGVTPAPDPAAVATPAAGAGAGRGGGPAAAALGAVRKYSVFGVFVIMVIVFAAEQPGRFLTGNNIQVMLADSVVLSLAAVGLTIVLALGQFDLSFAAVIGLSGAVAIFAMHSMHQSAGVAILLALAVGAAVGIANGAIVSFGRVPALIGTLAVSSAATGVEEAIMHQNTVSSGISQSYLNLTTKHVIGLPAHVVLLFVVIIVLWFTMSLTTVGRRIYAVGSGEEAARLSAVRTSLVKFSGFVILGVVAAVAGVVTTSQAASYYPNSGTPYLLPAYAAAFLGFSALGSRRFHPLATYFGVIFTVVLSTGLTMLNAPPWATNLSEGIVLAAAVLLVRAGRRA